MSGQPNPPRDKSRILALCGGVGGAKLALGLYRVLEESRLTVLVNTGDDFEHLGLHISPDIDTVLYTLAGVADPQRGWGRRDETWNCLEALEALGAENWFLLGDKDLAVHIERSRRLRAGEALSHIVGGFARQLGIAAEIVPMSDDPLRTLLDTDEGRLSFQEYFVKRQCQPKAEAISFAGAETAQAAPGVLAALRAADYDAVIICPSNPLLSIDPMLQIAELRDALAETRSPVIAVSPLVGGLALKGPAAKLFSELGRAPNVQAIADHYRGLIDGFVIDRIDEDQAAALPVATLATQTVMRSIADREDLARACIAFSASLKDQRPLAGRQAKG